MKRRLVGVAIPVDFLPHVAATGMLPPYEIEKRMERLCDRAQRGVPSRHIPADATVVGCSVSESTRYVLLTLEHYSFPEWNVGDTLDFPTF